VTETAILAIVTFATLVANFLFTIWKARVAERAAERAAVAVGVQLVAAAATHQAVVDVGAKVAEVHTTVSAQPDKTDLTSAVAALTAVASGPSVVVVTPSAVELGTGEPPTPPPGLAADTRASG
jgi:hypothetical protein